MSLAPGSRLGPYEIGAPLGAGGMGEVFGGRDTRLGGDVAIKVPPPGFARNEESRAPHPPTRESEELSGHAGPWPGPRP